MRPVTSPRWGSLLLAAVALLGWLVTWLVVAPTPETGVAVALAVAAASLLALARYAAATPPGAVALASTGVTTRDAGPPLPQGRVTDPVHHPLRPRAPGTD